MLVGQVTARYRPAPCSLMIEAIPAWCRRSAHASGVVHGSARPRSYPPREPATVRPAPHGTNGTPTSPGSDRRTAGRRWTARLRRSPARSRAADQRASQAAVRARSSTRPSSGTAIILASGNTAAQMSLFSGTRLGPVQRTVTARRLGGRRRSRRVSRGAMARRLVRLRRARFEGAPSAGGPKPGP